MKFKRAIRYSLVKQSLSVSFFWPRCFPHVAMIFANTSSSHCHRTWIKPRRFVVGVNSKRMLVQECMEKIAFVCWISCMRCSEAVCSTMLMCRLCVSCAEMGECCYEGVPWSLSDHVPQLCHPLSIQVQVYKHVVQQGKWNHLVVLPIAKRNCQGLWMCLQWHCVWTLAYLVAGWCYWYWTISAYNRNTRATQSPLTLNQNAAASAKESWCLLGSSTLTARK